MRLIDADALMRDIEQYHLSNGKFQHWTELQPTIDAVPVIRCKDCKKFVDEEDQSYCTDMYGQCSSNGFCAWAERKEE